jgi:N-methylhydantoinase A
MTGFPAVDVKNVGAGGGSIAWLDEGGMLHVGPQSAGAVPGPACYGAGGSEPTVTDCALLLGYLDAHFFLGGAMPLHRAAAEAALAPLAARMGLAPEPAAAAVLAVATEAMVAAVSEITVNQGMDPAAALLVGGGGAAGLMAAGMARRLGCKRLLVPETGAALSAVGALLSELGTDFARVRFTTSDGFAFDAVNAVLAELAAECRAFAAGPGRGALETRIEFAVEARYPHQAWEIEVPLAASRFAGADDVARLVADFHAAHRRIFAVDDPRSAVELLTWRARVRCRLHAAAPEAAPAVDPAPPESRRIYLPERGWTEAAVRRFASLAPGEALVGPAIVQSPYTTVVLPPDATAIRGPGGLLIAL